MTIFNRVMGLRRAVIFRKDCSEEQLNYGSVDIESGRKKTPIIINLSLHERALPSRTYFHECLHVLFPKMSEVDIRAMEEATWQTLTTKQRFLLARKLYNRKWRGR